MGAIGATLFASFLKSTGQLHNPGTREELLICAGLLGSIGGVVGLLLPPSGDSSFLPPVEGGLLAPVTPPEVPLQAPLELRVNAPERWLFLPGFALMAGSGATTGDFQYLLLGLALAFCIAGLGLTLKATRLVSPEGFVGYRIGWGPLGWSRACGRCWAVGVQSRLIGERHDPNRRHYWVVLLGSGGRLHSASQPSLSHQATLEAARTLAGQLRLPCYLPGPHSRLRLERQGRNWAVYSLSGLETLQGTIVMALILGLPMVLILLAAVANLFWG